MAFLPQLGGTVMPPWHFFRASFIDAWNTTGRWGWQLDSRESDLRFTVPYV